MNVLLELIEDVSDFALYTVCALAVLASTTGDLEYIGVALLSLGVFLATSPARVGGKA